MKHLGLTRINRYKLTNRPALVDGGVLNMQAGSRGAESKYNSHAEILLPSGSIASPVTVLKSLNLAQALLDGLVVVGGLVALVVVFGSLPLAVGLMIFGVL